MNEEGCYPDKSGVDISFEISLSQESMMQPSDIEMLLETLLSDVKGYEQNSVRLNKIT